MSFSSIKRQVAELKRLLPPKPEPDPWKDSLFEMVRITYDESLSEEEKERLIEELNRQWPEPNTQYAREMDAQFLKFYGVSDEDATEAGDHGEAEHMEQLNS